MKKTLLMLILSGLFLFNSCDAMFEKYTVEFKSDKDKNNLPGAYEVRKGTIITEDDLPALTDEFYEIEKWHVNYVVNNVRKSEDFNGRLEVNSDVIFTAVWKEKELTEEEKKFWMPGSTDGYQFIYKGINGGQLAGEERIPYIYFNVNEDKQFYIDFNNLSYNDPNNSKFKIYKLPDISIKIYIIEWEYDLEKEKWISNEENDIFIKEVKMKEKFDSLYKEEYFSKFKKPDSNVVYNTFGFEIVGKNGEEIIKSIKSRSKARFLYIDNGDREGACTEELKIKEELDEQTIEDKLKDYLIYDDLYYNDFNYISVME